MKGGISETRIEKRIVITGDTEIDHDKVRNVNDASLLTLNDVVMMFPLSLSVSAGGLIACCHRFLLEMCVCLMGEAGFICELNSPQRAIACIYQVNLFCMKVILIKLINCALLNNPVVVVLPSLRLWLRPLKRQKSSTQICLSPKWLCTRKRRSPQSKIE